MTIIGYGCTNQEMEGEEGNIGNPRVKGWNLTIHDVAKFEKNQSKRVKWMQGGNGTLHC